MSRAVTPRAPWPVPPAQGGEHVERLAWCAAVAWWAPSKHNSQPWRFVVGGSSLELWTDPERSLPQSDPNRREMVLSCGAALHLVTVAAHALGVEVVATVLPDGNGTCSRGWSRSAGMCRGRPACADVGRPGAARARAAPP